MCILKPSNRNNGSSAVNRSPGLIPQVPPHNGGFCSFYGGAGGVKVSLFMMLKIFTIMALLISIGAGNAHARLAEDTGVQGTEPTVQVQQVIQWTETPDLTPGQPGLVARRGDDSLRMGTFEVAPTALFMPVMRGKGVDYSIAGPNGAVRNFVLTDQRKFLQRDFLGSVASYSANSHRTMGLFGLLSAKENKRGKEMSSRLVYGKNSIIGNNFRLDASAALVSGANADDQRLRDTAWRISGESDFGPFRCASYYEHKGADYKFLSLPTGEKDMRRLGMSIGNGPLWLRVTEGRFGLNSLSSPKGRVERSLEGEYGFNYYKLFPGTIRYKRGEKRETGTTRLTNDFGGTMRYAGKPFNGQLKGSYSLVRDPLVKRDVASESAVEVVPEVDIAGWLVIPSLAYRQKANLLSDTDSTDITVEATLRKEQKPSGLVVEGGVGYTATKGTDASFLDVVAAKVAVKQLRWKTILGYRYAGISITTEHRSMKQSLEKNALDRNYSIFLTLDLS